jgi:hypothetical protein
VPGTFIHPISFQSFLASLLTQTAERTVTPANVSATPFDISTGNFPYPPGSSSIFRPPTPALSGGILDSNGATDNVFEPSDWTADDQMWYLPPGPALFQNIGENSNVVMTDQGVNVGGMDLLDLMIMDPVPFPNDHMNGSGSFP